MIRALVVTVVAAVLAGCGGDGGAELERFALERRLLGRSLEQITVDPGGSGRPLLVLLHGEVEARTTSPPTVSVPSWSGSAIARLPSCS